MLKLKAIAFFLFLSIIFLTVMSFDFVNAQQITIRFASQTPVVHPISDAQRFFADLVNLKTNGKVKIVLYLGGALGAQPDTLEQVRAGAIEMGLFGAGAMGQFVEEFNIAPMYFMYRDTEHIMKAWSGRIGDVTGEIMLDRHGIRVLNSIWEIGERHLISTKPITSIDDLKGLEIRVPESPIHLKAWSSFGAVPTSTDLGEVYTALQTGVIEAAELPLDFIYTLSLFEPAKFVTMTGHANTVYVVAVNERFWQKLTPEYQIAIGDAALMAGVWSNKLILESAVSYHQKLEQVGVTFFQIDRDPFVRIIERDKEEYAKLWGGDHTLYEYIMQIE